MNIKKEGKQKNNQKLNIFYGNVCSIVYQIYSKKK